jgi:hypothetical protein
MLPVKAGALPFACALVGSVVVRGVGGVRSMASMTSAVGDVRKWMAAGARVGGVLPQAMIVGSSAAE